MLRGKEWTRNQRAERQILALLRREIERCEPLAEIERQQVGIYGTGQFGVLPVHRN